MFIINFYIHEKITPPRGSGRRRQKNPIHWDHCFHLLTETSLHKALEKSFSVAFLKHAGIVHLSLTMPNRMLEEWWCSEEYHMMVAQRVKRYYRNKGKNKAPCWNGNCSKSMTAPRRKGTTGVRVWEASL